MTARNSADRSALLVEQLHRDLVAAYDEIDRLEQVANAAREFLFGPPKAEGDYSDLDALASAIEEYDDWCEDNTEEHVPCACADCGTDTTPEEGPWEWYMVQESIWVQANPDKTVNYLCIGCLERRLGRQLTAADFTNVPINALTGWGHKAFSDRTPRLLTRLTTT